MHTTDRVVPTNSGMAMNVRSLGTSALCRNLTREDWRSLGGSIVPVHPVLMCVGPALVSVSRKRSGRDVGCFDGIDSKHPKERFGARDVDAAFNSAL